MTQLQVIDRVNALLVGEFELESTVLQPEARMREDLGLDSLDALDLIVLIEKDFGHRMENEEARSMRTLGDVYRYIETHWSKEQP